MIAYNIHSFRFANLASGDTTKTILADNAIACAYWISNAVSNAHASCVSSGVLQLGWTKGQ